MRKKESPQTLGSDEVGFDFTGLVGHLLRRAYQRHTAIFQQKTRHFQLTAAQFAALCAIRNGGGSSLNQIVRATAIDQATIRGIVERLKARSLIEVDTDSEDKRKLQVSLTAGGKDIVDQAIPVILEITELTFDGLSPVERVALVYLLRKVGNLEGSELIPPAGADELG